MITPAQNQTCTVFCYCICHARGPITITKSNDTAMIGQTGRPATGTVEWVMGVRLPDQQSRQSVSGYRNNRSAQGCPVTGTIDTA